MGRIANNHMNMNEVDPARKQKREIPENLEKLLRAISPELREFLEREGVERGKLGQLNGLITKHYRALEHGVSFIVSDSLPCKHTDTRQGHHVDQPSICNDCGEEL